MVRQLHFDHGLSHLDESLHNGPTRLVLPVHDAPPAVGPLEAQRQPRARPLWVRSIGGAGLRAGSRLPRGLGLGPAALGTGHKLPVEVNGVFLAEQTARQQEPLHLRSRPVPVSAPGSRL